MLLFAIFDYIRMTVSTNRFITDDFKHITNELFWKEIEWAFFTESQ